jgi:hypothetical protein
MAMGSGLGSSVGVGLLPPSVPDAPPLSASPASPLSLFPTASQPYPASSPLRVFALAQPPKPPSQPLAYDRHSLPATAPARKKLGLKVSDYARRDHFPRWC